MADRPRYDNCYATSNNTMVDSSSAESQSPARFQHMAAELDSVNRDIQYYVCQWGIGHDVGEWASKIGNTYRISNDIYNAWRSIWRITNQVVRISILLYVRSALTYRYQICRCHTSDKPEWARSLTWIC
jgi:hypothetical protein